MAQLLPDGLGDPARADSVTASVRKPTSYGESWEFDFERRRLVLKSGRAQRVSGVRCLEQWMRAALATRRYRYPVYGPDFGTTFSELIGESVGVEDMESAASSQVIEALSIDPRIARVGLVAFSEMPGDASAVRVDMLVETFDAEPRRVEFVLEV